jgi:predicted kinase
MSKTHVLVGLPGSGKSTFAKALNAHGDYTIISRDDIVEEYAEAHGLTYDQAWSLTLQTADSDMEARLEMALERGDMIIWDQTNLTVKSRRRVLNRLKGWHNTIYATYFEVDEAVRQARLAQRHGKTIPPHIEEQMRRSYVRPSVEEGFHGVRDGVQVLAEIDNYREMVAA